MYELPKYRVVVLAGSAPLPHFAAQLPPSSQQLFQFFATRSGLCHSEVHAWQETVTALIGASLA